LLGVDCGISDGVDWFVPLHCAAVEEDEVEDDGEDEVDESEAQLGFDSFPYEPLV
jgi:hypothetical protein